MSLRCHIHNAPPAYIPTALAVKTGRAHNFKELVEALKYFSNKPICVIAKTIKGKGVDFMEGSVVWHYRPPTEKDLLEALEQIEGSKS